MKKYSESQCKPLNGSLRSDSLGLRFWEGFQEDQTINKKNKFIIYKDIGVLSLHSTTPNTAHENYSTENTLYQEWQTRSMNNLSLLSLSKEDSPKIRNEAKQKKNLTKKKKKHPTKPNGKPTNQQAPGTQFKRLT